MRVVLDTNVVVSALLFEKGRLTWLRQAWMAGRCRPVVSQATVEELLRVLSYPKLQLEEDEREDLLGEYLTFAETTVVRDRTPGTPVCDDADDQKFLDLAFAAGAEAIITGDKALLRLADRCPVEILSPAEAHDRLCREVQKPG